MSFTSTSSSWPSSKVVSRTSAANHQKRRRGHWPLVDESLAGPCALVCGLSGDVDNRLPDVAPAHHLQEGGHDRRFETLKAKPSNVGHRGQLPRSNEKAILRQVPAEGVFVEVYRSALGAHAAFLSRSHG
jgi:hypothetical protein